MRVLKTVLLVVLMCWAGLALAAKEKVTLNLKGADINTLIGTVAEVTGKNFIIDPRVKGKVTIISSRSLNRDQVYQVFLSVLEVHGFSAVPSGRVVKILPAAEAKHSGVPMVPESSPGWGDELVTRVIEVNHVTAAQLVPILRPLVPPQGHLAAYPQSNMLIVSDRAGNIRRLVNIVKRIDQPSSGEIEFVQLEHASASDVVKVLNTLQQQERKAEGGSSKPILVADERSNSIMIGGDKASRVQLRAIIAHLDTPTTNTGDTHVVYLRYAKAADLVPVLTGVQEVQAKVGVSTGGTPPGGAKPPTAKTVSRPVSGRGGTGGGSIFDIQADESTNALVITAPPAVFRSLEEVIKKLDVRRAQVMVEAIIAEVSLTKSAELGIEWAVLDEGGNSVPAAMTNFSGNLTSLGGAAASGTTPTSFPGGATVGVGRIVQNGISFAGLLNALKTDGATNVLSTPNLVTLDNEEAEIFVGEEVSIPSGTYTSTGTGTSPSNPFTTYSRTKVGLALKVKPQISEGNAIKLEIDQKVDGIIGGTAGAEDLQTSERSIKTTVMVDDGKILVLGGLIKEDLVETESKVPLLGDIPLIGLLFRHARTEKRKTNLMVFLRPMIMRDEQRGLALTQNKYDFIRAKQEEMRKRGVALMFDSEVPVAPAFEEQMELPPPYQGPGTVEEGGAKVNINLAPAAEPAGKEKPGPAPQASERAAEVTGQTETTAETEDVPPPPAIENGDGAADTGSQTPAETQP